jgi:DNA-binding NarL/FixJ family response regulator
MKSVPALFTVGLAIEQPMLLATVRQVLDVRSEIQVSILSNPLPAHFHEAVDVLLIDDKHSGFFQDPMPEQHTQWLRQCPTVLVAARDKDWIWQMHKTGVVGLLNMSSNPNEIPEALYSAWKGGRYFSQTIVDILVEMSFAAQPANQEKRHDQLSEREMEIFLLVANGKSTKDIAETLFLSPHTVNTHRKNILKKLSCKNAAELLNYAYNQRLLAPSNT